MHIIDLRSDTVTQPTQQMRDAMYRAEVGDDVFSDDPSVNELEILAAKLLGKESALLVTSGTQGNMVSVMAHTRRGDAIIIGRESHIAAHEAGTYAMLAGVSAAFPQDDNGIMRPESIRSLICDDSGLQSARTGLICLENAHSNSNVIPVKNMAEIYKIAKEHGIPVHLDGARLFNAAACLGVEIKELTQCCDSVMCCLSKGLCAPVGSIVAGDADFIRRARKLRKALGGGMRQAGFLAEAGKIALTKMPRRLKDDHDNAKYLAGRLKAIDGVTIDLSRVKINMFFFSVDWPAPFIEALPAKLLEKGIKILPTDGMDFRFVTHSGVSRQDCDSVINAIQSLLIHK